MNVEELRAYAKEKGISKRCFEDMFRPLLDGANRELNEYESSIAMIAIDRQVEFNKWMLTVIKRHRAEREERKKKKVEE